MKTPSTIRILRIPQQRRTNIFREGIMRIQFNYDRRRFFGRNDVLDIRVKSLHHRPKWCVLAGRLRILNFTVLYSKVID